MNFGMGIIEPVFEKCDGYLDGRTGTYEFRCRRYDAVIDVILRQVDLENSYTIADLAAGWTEFGHRFTERGFRGRYIPYDGAIDGKDLQHWVPPLAKLDVIVAIEFLEHLRHPGVLAEIMLQKAEKMVVVTTPNSAIVNTLKMDPDHVTALYEDDLYDMGFENVHSLPLFAGSEWNPRGDDDTLIGWTLI